MDGSVESVLMERITDGQLLITQIRECVEFRDAKGLKTYILEHKLSDQSVFWELTSELTQYVTEDILDKNPNFFEACERCLSYLVRNGNPKEMILALLEQADCFNDDVKYRTLLKLVQATLLKLPSKRFHSLDIALETLSAHVKSLQVPQFADFEDEERQLHDTDINVHRIEDVVSAYLNFLRPFVEEVSLFKACRTGKNNPQVLTLKKHLLFLLEHPLAYLDLEYDRKEEKAKTTSRCLAERTLDLLVHVERNFHKYLELARCGGACVDDLEEAEDTDAMVRENEENERRLDGQKRSAFERDDNDKMENWKYVKSVPKLAQACLSYLMYVEHLGLNRLPTIYSWDFLLEFNLPFISLCLQRQEFLIVHKGLLLLNSFLDVLKLGSLSADVLDNSAYMTMTSDVLAIVIHCPARKLRQMCVQLLPVFIKCFSSEGQYKLLHMIIASCEHSGVQGFVTQILKEQISDNLQCELPKRFFIGNSLDKILKLLVKLPDGPATDLLENSDRIISVLNLLRFLIIRDKPNQNVTGIWTSFPRYETQFIDALRMGLDMSTAHYKLELTNLLEAKGDQRAIPEDLDFSVCVGGESLSAMPKGQRISVLQSALITFDMIESLMVRLLELRDQQKAAYGK
ncbi:glomulin-like isoform X1 [Haliotis rufescens]|uniref:glomulin-like isoform X1 n=1 Tax=Haliotis rufescens TaxID=6454 RepID=UPI001EB00E41|nr:glomulin-like isoform X1 [Haliotis rufescens]XP_046329563.1 glomulin-like isoform X1 [Haliotis rufescens]